MAFIDRICGRRRRERRFGKDDILNMVVVVPSRKPPTTVRSSNGVVETDRDLWNDENAYSSFKTPKKKRHARQQEENIPHMLATPSQREEEEARDDFYESPRGHNDNRQDDTDTIDDFDTDFQSYRHSTFYCCSKFFLHIQESYENTTEARLMSFMAGKGFKPSQFSKNALVAFLASLFVEEFALTHLMTLTEETLQMECCHWEVSWEGLCKEDIAKKLVEKLKENVNRPPPPKSAK